jgi:hypothetical protein
MAQQAKANAARAEARVARPGEGEFHTEPRLALPPIISPSSFCLSSAFGRSGGGGATKCRQRARHGRKQLRLRPRLQPPGQDHQGREKAAYCPETRYSPQSFVLRLASPIFLTAASPYHEVLTVAQHTKANAARVEAEAARPGEG